MAPHFRPFPLLALTAVALGLVLAMNCATANPNAAAIPIPPNVTRKSMSLILEREWSTSPRERAIWSAQPAEHRRGRERRLVPCLRERSREPRRRPLRLEAADPENADIGKHAAEA